MRSLLLAGLLTIACAAAHAAKLPAGDFLNLPLDVRTLGMAEAGQGVAAGAGAVAVNPAALASIEAHQLYFTHAFLLAGVGSDYMSYGATLGEHHHLGISYHHVGYGTLDGRDDAGNLTASFGPSDTVYGFTYGTDIWGADVAGSLKYVDSTIVASAQTMTFDVGGKYALGENWVLGLTGRNLGGSLKYETESFPLPTAVAAGAGWRALEDWWLALDVVNPVYNPSYVSIGSEYAVEVKDLGTVAFRAGVNSKTPDLGFLSGLKAGLGLKVKSLDIDYSFSPGGDLGSTHHIGIGYRFGTPETKSKSRRRQD